MPSENKSKKEESLEETVFTVNAPDFTSVSSLEVITANINNGYVDYNNIKTEIREKLSKYFYVETECKPMIIAVIQEV